MSGRSRKSRRERTLPGGCFRCGKRGNPLKKVYKMLARSTESIPNNAGVSEDKNVPMSVSDRSRFYKGGCIYYRGPTGPEWVRLAAVGKGRCK